MHSAALSLPRSHKHQGILMLNIPTVLRLRNPACSAGMPSPVRKLASSVSRGVADSFYLNNPSLRNPLADSCSPFKKHSGFNLFKVGSTNMFCKRICFSDLRNQHRSEACASSHSHTKSPRIFPRATSHPWTYSR